VTERELINSPAELLVSFFNEKSCEAVLILLSGERGVGKTSWILALIAAADRLGIACSGVVSPPVYEGGVKTAIDCLDARSRQRFRLAERRDEAAPEQSSRRRQRRGWREKSIGSIPAVGRSTRKHLKSAVPFYKTCLPALCWS
jgi:hypothetical protein